MKTHSPFLIVVTLCFYFCFAEEADAMEMQGDGPIPAHRFRLGMEKTLLSARYVKTTDTEDGIHYASRAGGIGLAGIGSGSTSLNLGYRITDRFTAGSRLGVGGWHSRTADDNSFTDISIGILPYVELWFGEADIRPFVVGLLEVQINLNNQAYGKNEFDYAGYGFGGHVGGGVHIFVGDRISLDGVLTGGYIRTTERTEWTDDTPSEVTSHQGELSGNLGISGWI